MSSGGDEPEPSKRRGRGCRRCGKGRGQALGGFRGLSPAAPVPLLFSGQPPPLAASFPLFPIIPSLPMPSSDNSENWMRSLFHERAHLVVPPSFTALCGARTVSHLPWWPAEEFREQCPRCALAWQRAIEHGHAPYPRPRPRQRRMNPNDRRYPASRTT